MSKVVASGEHVVLFINSSSYYFAEVAPQKKLYVGRQNLACTELEGKQYGVTFSIDRGRLVPINADDLMQLKNELAPEADQVPDANNSLLVDDNTSQKLSQADIVAMKEKGVSGKDLIKAIVGNSSTFHTKTDYSKEKYLKKKSLKHITTVQILRGTANNILTAYYTKSPHKICSLRGDSLALMLNLANIFAHPDKKVLVAENCQGLIIGSVAERMGGLGKIYLANLEASKPSLPAFQSFNFPKSVEDSVITIPISLISSLSAPSSSSPSSSSSSSSPSTLPSSTPAASSSESSSSSAQATDSTSASGQTTNSEVVDAREAQRARTREEAQALVRDGADSLLVCVSKYAPQSIVPRLVRALKGGAAFAVFAQSIQPLAETHELLRNAGIATNVSIAETWLRVHQVLPARTHPNMHMDGASGYILNGVRIIPDGYQKEKRERAEKKEGEGKGKEKEKEKENDEKEGSSNKRKSSEENEDQPEQKVTKVENN